MLARIGRRSNKLYSRGSSQNGHPLLIPGWCPFVGCVVLFDAFYAVEIRHGCVLLHQVHSAIPNIINVRGACQNPGEPSDGAMTLGCCHVCDFSRLLSHRLHAVASSVRDGHS
jgi:hypothetical protein